MTRQTLAPMIEGSSPAGARALERLERDIVAWIVTVSPAGRPQSSVIWFLWHENEILIYSRPHKPKVRNIEANPHVAFTLNSDDIGDDMLTVEGVARIDGSFTPADQLRSYIDKYDRSIDDLGMTPASFAEAYSVPILMTPSRARYW